MQRNCGSSIQLWWGIFTFSAYKEQNRQYTKTAKRQKTTAFIWKAWFVRIVLALVGCRPEGASTSERLFWQFRSGFTSVGQWQPTAPILLSRTATGKKLNEAQQIVTPQKWNEWMNPAWPYPITALIRKAGQNQQMEWMMDDNMKRKFQPLRWLTFTTFIECVGEAYPNMKIRVIS